MCRQLLRIRRDATISRLGDITLMLTHQPIAPFSFFRSIYVWANTPSEDMKAIVAHESSHIAHRHSFERIAMEFTKALLWWNPLVWLTAYLLTEVEEFEADSDVLRDGFDTQTYMNAIFRQLFGYSPDIANGLRNSLTKKRFLMMTTQTQSRYDLLRLAGILPAVLGLLCAFSLTSKAAVILPAAATPISPSTTSTASNANNGQSDEAPSLIAEVMPKFQDGDLNNFRQWIQAQMNYPAEALKHKIQGSIVLSFVIEKDGSVSDIVILQTPDKSLADEAQRIVASSPRWTPGTVQGKAVRVKYTLLVDFGTTSDPTPTNKEVSITIKDGIITKTTTEIIGKAPQAPVTDENAPILIAEVMPKFQDGDLNNFRQWVQAQIQYPEAALKKKITGRVVLSFAIEKDGSVSNILILQTPDKSLADEAQRVIASSPRWTPGTVQGKAVRVKYTLPVDFRQPEVTTPPATAAP